jgi:hypothetical protein
MAELDVGTRKKIIEKQKARYMKSTKKGKSAILDAVCTSTGLSRSRAKHLLTEKGNNPLPSLSGRSGRNRKYGQKVREAIEKTWELMDYAGGKRLCAGLPDMLDALQRCGECSFDEETRKLLLEMSPATADRLLKRKKEKMLLRGRSTTKPGTLLKRDIPLRLGTEWDEDMPGFIECDLVAHCGSTTAGEYINTLDVTDVKSGWTETRAVINKARRFVFEALKNIEEKLPFPLLGIDSDNGSEFINAHLYGYCKERGICFTRSRPYMKNDNCHVEQKNRHVVRRNIGYGRYEGKEAVRMMNEYYALLRLYTNFFMPHMKLISKTRDGAGVRKRYDMPTTPYRRLLSDDNVSTDVKESLTNIHMSLNPAALKRDMDELLDKLAKMIIHG